MDLVNEGALKITRWLETNTRYITEDQLYAAPSGVDDHSTPGGQRVLSWSCPHRAEHVSSWSTAHKWHFG